MGRLLRISEAAERMALSEATIRKLLYLRRLPRVKLGRATRLREEDLELMIQQGYQPARRGERR